MGEKVEYVIGADVRNLGALELMDIAAALDTLSAFMKASAVARRMRAAGSVREAIASEDMAMNHYDRLPENWRW